MRKISLVILLITSIIIGFTECKQMSRFSHLTIPFSNTSQFTIPDNLPIIKTPYPITSLPASITDIEAALTDMGYKVEMVEKIEVQSLDLVLNTPEDGDLSFFETIHVYIEADGLEKVLLADKTIPESTTRLTEISLDCKKINLADYLQKEGVNLSADITTKQEVIGEHVIDVNSELKADVKVLDL